MGRDLEKKRAYQREYNKTYFQVHKEEIYAYKRAYDQTHPRKDKAAHYEYLKTRRRRIKREVFEAYGGCCCLCCGENHIEFLSIDHIEGNGAAHRRSLGKQYGPGARFYSWLKREGYPPGFRVLCMNCNAALGWFGYCPHSTLSKNSAT